MMRVHSRRVKRHDSKAEEECSWQSIAVHRRYNRQYNSRYNAMPNCRAVAAAWACG